MCLLRSVATYLYCLELDRVRELCSADKTERIESVVLSILLDSCGRTYSDRVEKKLHISRESILIDWNTEVRNN